MEFNKKYRTLRMKKVDLKQNGMQISAEFQKHVYFLPSRISGMILEKYFNRKEVDEIKFKKMCFFMRLSFIMIYLFSI